MSNETPYESAEDVTCTNYLKSNKLCNKWVIKGTVEKIKVHKTDKTQYVLLTFVHDLDHKVVITNGKESETYTADELKFVLKQIYDRNENDFIEKIIRGYLISVGCREPEYGIKYFHNFNSIMVWSNSNYRIGPTIVEGSKVAVSVIDNQISIKNNGELNFVNHRVCSDIVPYDQNPDLVTTIRKSNDKKVKNNMKESIDQSKDSDLFKTPPRIKRTTIQTDNVNNCKKIKKGLGTAVSKVINFDDETDDDDLY